MLLYVKYFHKSYHATVMLEHGNVTPRLPLPLPRTLVHGCARACAGEEEEADGCSRLGLPSPVTLEGGLGEGCP